jgi:hypothetical protein
MIELKEWIEDGITIRKTGNGYQVFTIPTQHFDVTELNELIPDRFRAEVEKQKNFKELQDELWNQTIGKRVNEQTADLFKDLFND